MNNGVLNKLGGDRLRIKPNDQDTHSLPVTSLDSRSLPRRSRTTIQIADMADTYTLNTEQSSIMSTPLFFAVFNSFWRTHAVTGDRPNSTTSKLNCFEYARCFSSLINGV